MDPNATLEIIRSNAAVLIEHDDPETARELAEAVTALDEWLSKGGFLPTDWLRA